MPKIKLSAEFLAEEVMGSKDLVVRDEQDSTGRWCEHRTMVFRHDDKLYSVGYQRPLTEIQECDLFYDEEEVECTEVEAYERTVTDYRAV